MLLKNVDTLGTYLFGKSWRKKKRAEGNKKNNKKILCKLTYI